MQKVRGQKSLSNRKQGFTLIEILVVIGLIAILAAIVLIAINPARQFAQAHNSQRTSNAEAILNAIGQNLADNKGVFTCGTTPHTIPVGPTDITSVAGGEDLAPCLVPTYMSSMPVDPVGSTTPACVPLYTSNTSYETCYSIARDTVTNRITISAPDAELGQVISITR